MLPQDSVGCSLIENSKTLRRQMKRGRYYRLESDMKGEIRVACTQRVPRCIKSER